jgi:hypothetical protein
MVVLLVVVRALARPVAVWAAVANRYDGNVERQRARYRTTSLTTSSTAWHSVSLSNVTICAINEVSATVSVNLTLLLVRITVA